MVKIFLVFAFFYIPVSYHVKKLAKHCTLITASAARGWGGGLHLHPSNYLYME
jgi:hypothetical protein